MRMLVFVIRLFAACVDRLLGRLAQIQMLLYGLLPALLPPEELTRMIRLYYDRSYWNSDGQVSTEAYPWTLATWEQEVLGRHMADPGTVLVLGAGSGRESIALAQHGYRVVGLDTNRDGLRIACRQAAMDDSRAAFVQADFLAPPILPSNLNYIFVSGVMYSSVPGKQRRQDWVRSLRSNLKQGGKIVLNFVVAREPETGVQRFIDALNRRLLLLPGSNKTYQPGDFCSQGHFMHAFADEQEIRSELAGAGATIHQVSLNDGFAVVSFSQSS
jgi:SAM-dependent methyltransferase